MYWNLLDSCLDHSVLRLLKVEQICDSCSTLTKLFNRYGRLWLPVGVNCPGQVSRVLLATANWHIRTCELPAHRTTMISPVHRGVQPSKHCETQCACIEDAPKNVVSRSIVVFEVSARIQRLLTGHHDIDVPRQPQLNTICYRRYVSIRGSALVNYVTSRLLTGIGVLT